MFGQSRENHKYIRKYRSKSGKWVYVYADQKTHDSIEEDTGNSHAFKYRSDNLHEEATSYARASTSAALNGQSARSDRFARLANERYHQSYKVGEQAERAAASAQSKISSNSIKSISQRAVKSVATAVKDPKYVERHEDSSGKTHYVYAKKETHDRIATAQKTATRDSSMSRDYTNAAKKIYDYDLKNPARSDKRSMDRAAAVYDTKQATQKRSSAAANNALADSLIRSNSANVKLSNVKKMTVSKAQKFVSKYFGH